MKKRYLLLAVLCALAIPFAGCGKTVSVTAITASGPAEIAAGEFDPSDFSLLVRYSDGTEKTIPATGAMFREDEVAALSAAGEYDLTVTYEGKTDTVHVKVVENAPPEDTASHAVILYQEGNILHIAVVGDIAGTYENTAYAGIDLVLSYTADEPGIVAAAEGVQTYVNRDKKFIRIVFVAAENVVTAREIAALSVGDETFSAASVTEVQLYDANQDGLSVDVWFGNDYYPA